MKIADGDARREVAYHTHNAQQHGSIRVCQLSAYMTLLIAEQRQGRRHAC